MKPVTVTATVRAPIQHVYEYVADSHNDPQWCPLVKEVHLLEGTAGRQGALYHFVQIGFRGRAMDGTIRLTAAQPNEYLRWQVEDPVRESMIEMTFERDGKATRVTQASHPRFRGVWRAAAPLLIRRKTEAMLAKQFRRLDRQLVRVRL